jgi:hypothetical protein
LYRELPKGSRSGPAAGAGRRRRSMGRRRRSMGGGEAAWKFVVEREHISSVLVPFELKMCTKMNA